MFVHGFDSYRVFISAPGDLDRERDACRSAISEVNAEAAMPSKVLLVSVGLMQDGAIATFRSAVSDNIRQSSYHIQVFQDDWGPRDLFRKMFALATECRDDNTLPMQEVIVCLKDAPNETNPEILAFRKELEERQDVRIFRFKTTDELKDLCRAVSKEWVTAILAAGGGVSQGAASV